MERLQSELEETEAAIALVASGSASRVTLTSFRFGEELVAGLQSRAAGRGVVLEAIPWPEDAGCDVVVRAIDA